MVLKTVVLKTFGPGSVTKSLLALHKNYGTGEASAFISWHYGISPTLICAPVIIIFKDWPSVFSYSVILKLLFISVLIPFVL